MPMPFSYLLAEVTSVCCTIVATCMLKFRIVEHVKVDELIFSANSYHLLYGGTFLTSFSLFMLSLIRPDHFYQVRLESFAVGLGSWEFSISDFRLSLRRVLALG